MPSGTSSGGQLIRELLLETGDFTLLNNLDLCEGGPFTWEQAGNKEIRSCLDLALASSNLLPFVKKMVIDVERKFTARRIIKKKTSTKTIFTDHYGVKVILEGMNMGQRMGKKEITWNMNKPGGWEDYERLTGEAAAKVKQVVENAAIGNKDANEVMKKVEAIENEIKFKAFGKTKPPSKKKLSAKKHLTEEELLRKQSQTIEEEIMKIQSKDKSKLGRVYKMKDHLVGGKKEKQEPAAIIDPSNNELVVSAEEIKKVTLEYCKNNLKKRHLTEETDEGRKIKVKLHQLRMEDTEEEDFLIDKEDFKEVLSKFKKKSTSAYNMIVKAHEHYQEAIF